MGLWLPARVAEGCGRCVERFGVAELVVASWAMGGTSSGLCARILVRVAGCGDRESWRVKMKLSWLWNFHREGSASRDWRLRNMTRAGKRSERGLKWLRVFRGG